MRTSTAEQDGNQAVGSDLSPATSLQGAEARGTDWRRAFGLREMGVYYALILLVLILSFATTSMGRGNYLSILNISDVLYQSSLTCLMAIAMTVILITGNFDLSVASVAALSGAVLMGTADTVGFWPAVVIAMGVAVIAGVINGSIVQFLGINAFIVTLGTLTAIRGLVLIYMNGRSLAAEQTSTQNAMSAFENTRIDVGLGVAAVGALLLVWGIWHLVRRKSLTPPSLGMILCGLGLLVFTWSGNFSIKLQAPVLYMAIYAAVVWFVLRFTTIGRKIYAVGGNPEAARLSGINVTAYKLAAFILCSATAGFAGILFGCRLESINPSALQGAELTVIASAILGGTSLFGGAGSVLKTLAGALLLYTLTNGFNILNLGANYQGLIEGLVVVAAAAIYTVGGQRRGKLRTR